MKILDRYLMQRMAGALVRALVALVFMYLLIDLLTHRRDNILKYDIPWQAVLTYYAAFAPEVAFQLAPLAMLVSALLVLGDAAQNNEVTAALAGGIGLRRFARVPVLVALALTAAVFVLQETVGPSAAAKAEEIEENYFTSTSKKTREGVSWAGLSGGWTVHVQKFNRIALTGEGVILHRIGPRGIEHIQARRIFWDESRGEWLIEDGHWFSLAAGGEQARRPARRVTQAVAPLEETPDRLFSLERAPETKSAAQLWDDVTRARERGMPAQRAQVDLHAKFAQPALSFIMIWLAVPFALRLRRGGLAISFGASIAVALAYLVVFAACMQLGYMGRIGPVAAAWFANAVFLAAGLVLFWRTPT